MFETQMRLVVDKWGALRKEDSETQSSGAAEAAGHEGGLRVLAFEPVEDVE